MTQLSATDSVRIAVSQRVEEISARDEHRDALDMRLVQWLRHVGALAYPVPNGLIADGALSAWLVELSPQGILLSGGNDIGDSPERDATEIALLHYAAELNLPVLGICRGMQMMAHQAGAVLEPTSGHAATDHSLFSDNEEVVPTRVNSYHNWSVQTCPDEYRVIARASDDGIEAIRHIDRDWEAWMWHPEREEVFDEASVARARRLFCGRMRP